MVAFKSPFVVLPLKRHSSHSAGQLHSPNNFSFMSFPFLVHTKSVTNVKDSKYFDQNVKHSKLVMQIRETRIFEICWWREGRVNKLYWVLLCIVRFLDWTTILNSIIGGIGDFIDKDFEDTTNYISCQLA